MDCITPDLTAALDSLSKRYNRSGIDEWGKSHEKLEDILPSDDWRLKAINAKKDAPNRNARFGIKIKAN